MWNSLLVDFKYLKSTVMSTCNQVTVLVLVNDPVTIGLFPETIKFSFCLNIPNSKGSVFRVADQVASFLVKKNARYVVLVTSNCRMLPSDFVGVLPEFDFSVVWAWCDEVLGWVERHPINPSFVTLQHFDTLDFYANKWRKVLAFCQFFLQNRVIPDSDCRIQRSWNNEILFRMELWAHNIMAVASNDIDTSSTLIIPNSHSLIVTGR